MVEAQLAIIIPLRQKMGEIHARPQGNAIHTALAAATFQAHLKHKYGMRTCHMM